MKEVSKSESILNDYIMNTSELSSSNQQTYTLQTINNNLSLKLQSRSSTIKQNPFYIYNYPKQELDFNNLINFIECGNIQKIIDYLDKDISDINKLNDNGISPLHMAVINGNIEVINILLKYGSDPNKRSTNNRQTPLHFAYIFKNTLSNKIINLLLKYNANPNLEDINNKKPCEYGIKYKESNEVDDASSSNENENDNNNNLNIMNNQDSYNNDNNTYTISDNEPTITQTKTKSAYNIEDLIKCNQEFKDNIRIIGKESKSLKIIKCNKNIYSNNKKKNSVLVQPNKYYNILNDSINIDIKDEMNNNIGDYYQNRQNSYKNTKKLYFCNSQKNMRIKNTSPLGLSLSYNNGTYKTDNRNHKININEQYYFNNEFFNNFYNSPDYMKSRAKRRSFKIPKNTETRSNSGILYSSLSTNNNMTSKRDKSNIAINNNITEFVYPEDYDDDYSETDNTHFLNKWLLSIELPFYINNFTESKISDIKILINEAKENHNKVNYEFVENLLKIHKPGHIYRILCKLEVDAGYVEYKICNFLVGLNENTIENKSKSKNIAKNNFYLQSNESNKRCCNCCDIKKPLMEKRDLRTFLRKYKLLHLYDNFYHNGFNLINYVILQMFTKYSINDNIIQKCFHIYKKKDRYLVLDALFNEVKEINIFFSTNFHNYCLFPKYENNDWSSSLNDESISDNESSNNCNII